MSADKHPAEVTARFLELADWTKPAEMLTGSDAAHKRIAAMLRRIQALEAERDTYRARLDRAIAAAETHFGEDATRYKLSLFQNGRARNVFPQSMDGRWVALQRADDDAHIGLSLRVVEAEAERDQLRAEVEALREANSTFASASILPDDKVIVDKDEVEALRADAERYRWLRSDSQTVTGPCAYGSWMGLPMFNDELDSAIDAARKQQ